MGGMLSPKSIRLRKIYLKENERKRSGKPCIKGTRMPVSSVLSYLSSGMSVEELLADFPYISREDVLEAMAYASSMMNERLTPLRKAS